MRFIGKYRGMRLVIGLAALIIGVVVYGSVRASAACSPSTDFGVVSFSNVTVPETGNYRVWTRMQIPDATKNNFLLEINGGACVTVHGNGSLPKNTWTWVDFQNGTASSKINTGQLTANTPYSFRMLGTSDGVLVDRVIFTKIDGNGDTCTPSGLGNDCAEPADSTAPTVTLTAPANNEQITGTKNITATASDNSGTVKHVEFLVDGVSKLVDTSSPYSYSWNSTTSSNGAHTVTAKAVDMANNQQSITVNVTVSNTSNKTGDCNGDNLVNGLDLSILSFNYNKAGTFTLAQCDLSGDSKVTAADISLLSLGWGK